MVFPLRSISGMVTSSNISILDFLNTRKRVETTTTGSNIAKTGKEIYFCLKKHRREILLKKVICDKADLKS